MYSAWLCTSRGYDYRVNHHHSVSDEAGDCPSHNNDVDSRVEGLNKRIRDDDSSDSFAKSLSLSQRNVHVQRSDDVHKERKVDDSEENEGVIQEEGDETQQYAEILRMFKQPEQNSAFNSPNSAFNSHKKAEDDFNFVGPMRLPIKPAKIRPWTELDRVIYSSATIFMNNFGAAATHNAKLQKIEVNKCLRHLVVITPPPNFTEAQKLAYGQNIVFRIRDVFGINGLIHLHDKSRVGSPKYNQYYVKGPKPPKKKRQHESKPRELLVGNILPNDAAEGTVAVYGATAVTLAHFLHCNSPDLTLEQKAYLLDNSGKFRDSVQMLIDQDKFKDDKLPGANFSLQAIANRRDRANFLDIFKAAYEKIENNPDIERQIQGIIDLKEMYVEAPADHPYVNYQVTDIYVAALILKFKLYLRLNKLIEACDTFRELEQDFKSHGKFEREEDDLRKQFQAAEEKIELISEIFAV